MWNGIFLPIKKHRDYEHPNDFAGHLAASSGASIFAIDEDDRVELTVNPITGEELDGEETYYLLKIRIGATTYTYFIPASDGEIPSDEEIKKVIQEYITNTSPELRELRKRLADKYSR